MLNELNMWNKIGRLIAMLAKERGMTLSEATEAFYSSKFNKDLHDESTGLYLFGDLYLLPILLEEVQVANPLPGSAR